MPKTREDIEKINAIIYRLEELGVPKETTSKAWAWVRREELKIKDME